MIGYGIVLGFYIFVIFGEFFFFWCFFVVFSVNVCIVIFYLIVRIFVLKVEGFVKLCFFEFMWYGCVDVGGEYFFFFLYGFFGFYCDVVFVVDYVVWYFYIVEVGVV